MTQKDKQLLLKDLSARIPFGVKVQYTAGDGDTCIDCDIDYVSMRSQCAGRAFTSLEQSKKLAEILPIESADMWWAERYAGQVMANGQYIVEEKPVYYPSLTKPSNDNYSQDTVKDIPCWSLAALISILPNEIKHDGIVNNIWITSEDVSYYSKEYDSYLYCEEGCTVDACVEMIVKLKELNLL